MILPSTIVALFTPVLVGSFDGETIHSKRAFTAEGVYEFKVVLNNGNYATAKIEVKECLQQL